jgi:pimeloyl-ACP methyl ester carboxylesterase
MLQQYYSTQFNVIAYDTIGHGDSPIPDTPISLSSYLEQLLELIDYLGLEKVNLCGHSMGALIALAFAIERPQRVCRMISLMCAYDRSVEHQQRQSRTADMLTGADFEALLETTLERWFCEQDYLDEKRNEKISRVKSWLSRNNRKGYSSAYRVLAENGETYVGELHRVTAPALFITAELDPNSTPEMAEKMAAGVINGSCYVVPGERHMGQLLAAESFQPLISEFLQNSLPDE